MKKYNRYGLRTVAAATAIGIAAMTLVTPTYASEDECKDVTIVGARGTSEQQDYGRIQGFGDAVSEAVSVLENHVQAGIASDADFKNIDVTYPASSPSWGNGYYPEDGEGVWDVNEYAQSVASGVYDAAQQANLAVASCPNTTLIMMGYSQGAQVVHNATQYLEPLTLQRLAYVWLLSDPSVKHLASPDPALAYSFNQHIQKYSPHTVGAMHAFGTQSGPYGVTNMYFPSRLRNKVIEVCHDDDKICNIPYSDLDGYTGSGTLSGAIASAFISITDKEGAHGTAYKVADIHELPSTLAAPRIIRMVEGARGNMQVSGTTFPVTVSDCQTGTTNMQLIKRQEASDSPSCLRDTGTLRGGYGGLAEDSSNCEASTFLKETADGSPWSSSGPTNCDAILNSWISRMKAGEHVIIDIPVFGGVYGTGADTKYQVVSYKKFRIQGWRLDGTSYEPRTFRNTSIYTGTLACTGPCRGIIGHFLAS